KRDLAPALEAICQKAMAFRPEQRYSSAGELGADIERWLADEPVHAYVERLPQRAARWGRRHRSWVLAGTASLTAITLISVLAVVLLNAARDRATDAAVREADQRQNAETALS